FHSSSSGGTQAGLEAGRRMFFAPDVRLIGVSADDSSEAIASTVRDIMAGLSALLEISGDKAVEVDDTQIGPGYGIESEAGNEALGLVARTEGIFLDPVYTAKAMAALLGRIRSGGLTDRDTVLFWHTGGQLALFHRRDKDER